jgi:hypothetical protein
VESSSIIKARIKGTGVGTALPFPPWRLRAAHYLNYDPRSP